MDDISFRRMAVDSAKRYLTFLEQEDKGIVATEVSSITKRGGEAFLHLRGRLSPVGIDFLRLRVFADEYDTKTIHPNEYHRTRNVLILHPEKEFYDFLPSGKCKHIAVISDLRFLVERVRDWYLTDRAPIYLPRQAPDVTPPALIDMAGGIPTAEQYSAVCNVLTAPFSYVWGAPGTGKTRFVLANCVLAYLRKGKKVLLAAPTNNALEQMLFGILDVLRSCGIPASRALRLGIPSAAFAAKYPESCERLSSENRRASIVGELEYLARQQRNATLSASLKSAQATASGFYEQLEEISAQFQKSTVSEQELNAALYAYNQAQKTVNDLEDAVQALTIWVGSVPGRFARLFRPTLYSEKSSQLSASTRRLEGAKVLLENAARQSRRLESAAQAAYQSYCTRLEKLRAQYAEAFQNPPIPKLTIPDWIPLDAFPSRLRLACDAIQTAVERVSVPDGLNEDEIKDRICMLEAELAELNADHQSQWAKVQVLAMTIDRFISPNGSPVDFEPAHVFMDEAAYCSLIKGYTLLSLNCPVTLLGDHAQLPPVCEMKEQTLKRSFCPEFLWAQSAIHLDSAFQCSDLELYHEYIDTTPPRFYNLQVNMLSATHRFGPGLSRILSNFIYGGSLTSARSDETDVKYIHAPSSPSDISRTSKSECAAICSLAKELADNRVNLAILTPYKKQVALLSKSMPALSAAGRIMTIHAAQGREFHTVILSIVDTTDKFFTDSNNPIGRAVLNTAISRVKSNLILAIDYDYWRTQEQQLIGQLLTIADPYQLSS